MSAIRFSLVGALALVAAALAVTPAAQAARHERHHAAAPPRTPAGVETLGRAGAWSAYATREPSGKVCYLAGTPEKEEPAGFARRSPMAMVTHRPAEHISNVVSFVEGYPLKPDSNVVLDIDGRKFDLFTKDDSAWARTSELDRTIVAALEGGRIAIARGKPERGRPTTDVYSLAGFSKALEMIDKACDIKRVKPIAPLARAKPHHSTHRRAKHHSVKHHGGEHHDAEHHAAQH